MVIMVLELDLDIQNIQLVHHKIEKVHICPSFML